MPPVSVTGARAALFPGDAVFDRGPREIAPGGHYRGPTPGVTRARAPRMCVLVCRSLVVSVVAYPLLLATNTKAFNDRPVTGDLSLGQVLQQPAALPN